MEMDRPPFSFMVDVDGDRSQGHQLPGSLSFKEANEEEREPRTIDLTAPVAGGLSNCTEGDSCPLRSLYTSSNDGGSASLPSSLSSSLPKHMAVFTPQSSSPTKSDFIPAPPAPLSQLVPRDPPESPSKPTLPCLPREESIEAEGVASKMATGGGKGSASKKSHKSVSRLCFPFVTPKKDKDRKLVPGTENVSVFGSATSATIPAVLPSAVNPAPHLSSRPHQYLPTRFYPFPIETAAPVQKHPRHTYANRGYSQEALNHVKWFWIMRREGMKSGGANSYMEKEPQVARTVHPGSAHQARSSVGEPFPAAARGAASSTPTTTDPSKEKTVPASIHPRRGDISSLRDPQCAEVDRMFSALGVWTIAKMVWVVEVGVGMARREREEEERRRKRRSQFRVRILWDEERDEDGDRSLDLSTRSTSMSSLSDDSDMTLVEYGSLSSASFLKEDGDDEDAGDRLQLIIRGRKPTPQTQRLGGSSSGFTSASTTPSVSPGREFDSDFDKSNIGRSVPRAVYQSPIQASKHHLAGAGNCQAEWAADWMSRWEIVRNLSQAQKMLGYAHGYDNLLASTPTLQATSNTSE